MEINEKNILGTVLKNNGFVGVEDTSIQELLTTVQAGTLGNKVGAAMYQKKQGHFDQAMLNISEANRDHVFSIRKIRSILDEIEGVPPTEVIFEKYRQFFPFQIGLINSKDVLELLGFIKHGCDFDLEERILDLHKNEKMIGPLLEELHFYETRMKGRISDDDMNALTYTIETSKTRIFEMKMSLIESIGGVVREKYVYISPVENMTLVKNLYVILSSSIQTLDATCVDVEIRA